MGLAAAELDWEQRLSKFVGIHQSEIAKKKSGLQRLSNLDIGVKLDHIPQMGGMDGLTRFVSARPLRPLDKDESRSWVDGLVVEVLGASDPVELQLPCVAKGTSRHYELPRSWASDGSEVSPTRLHVHHDQGPVGWPFLTWAFKDLHINGVLEPDRFHI